MRALSTAAPDNAKRPLPVQESAIVARFVFDGGVPDMTFRNRTLDHRLAGPEP